MRRRTTKSTRTDTLFPYTTLVRSTAPGAGVHARRWIGRRIALIPATDKGQQRPLRHIPALTPDAPPPTPAPVPSPAPASGSACNGCPPAAQIGRAHV